MMSLTFGLFTQVSGSGPLGPLVFFQMFMYNELLFYNIKKNEWLKVTAPNGPPPRSAHQVFIVYRIYPAIRQGFCPSRMTSNK